MWNSTSESNLGGDAEVLSERLQLSPQWPVAHNDEDTVGQGTNHRRHCLQEVANTVLTYEPPDEQYEGTLDRPSLPKCLVTPIGMELSAVHSHRDDISRYFLSHPKGVYGPQQGVADRGDVRTSVQCPALDPVLQPATEGVDIAATGLVRPLKLLSHQ